MSYNQGSSGDRQQAFIVDLLKKQGGENKEVITASYRDTAQQFLEKGEYVVVMRSEGRNEIVYHGHDQKEAQRALEDAQSQHEVDLQDAAEQEVDPGDEEDCPPELLAPDKR